MAEQQKESGQPGDALTATAVLKGWVTDAQVAEAEALCEKFKAEGLALGVFEALGKKGYLNAEQVAELQAQRKAAQQAVAIPGYELLEMLGQGSMGTVFKARQKSMNRLVAIKLLPPSLAQNPEFVERFVREAHASAKVNHPNVVSGIDVGQANGLYYFVMELVEGRPLGDVLKEKGRLREDEVLKVGVEMARALEAISKAGLVHRDIKPQNIMVTLEGEAKLCDLGLARPRVEDASVTQDNTALGTPLYMSPEQARSERDLDVRSDIYSLGASLYHLLTGVPLFSGATSGAIMAQHLTGQVTDPRQVVPGVSDGLCRILRKMLAKSPKQRYRSAVLLREDLEALRQGLPLRHAGREDAPKSAAPAGPAVGVAIPPVPEQQLAQERSTAIRRSALILGGMAAVVVLIIIIFARRAPQAEPKKPGEVSVATGAAKQIETTPIQEAEPTPVVVPQAAKPAGVTPTKTRPTPQTKSRTPQPKTAEKAGTAPPGPADLPAPAPAAVPESAQPQEATPASDERAPEGPATGPPKAYAFVSPPDLVYWRQVDPGWTATPEGLTCYRPRLHQRIEWDAIVSGPVTVSYRARGECDFGLSFVDAAEPENRYDRVVVGGPDGHRAGVMGPGRGLSSLAACELADGGFHQVVVQRSQDDLSLKVDGREIARVPNGQTCNPERYRIRLNLFDKPGFFRDVVMDTAGAKLTFSTSTPATPEASPAAVKPPAPERPKVPAPFMAEMRELLSQAKFTEARARLKAAQEDPAFAAVGPQLSLDGQCIALAERAAKAVLEGAAALKDGREFILEQVDGKKTAVGGKSKNAVTKVEGDQVEIAEDVGGGKINFRFPLSRYSLRTREELARLALPPGADSLAVLAGVWLPQAISDSAAAKSYNALLDQAAKEGAAPELVARLREWAVQPATPVPAESAPAQPRPEVKAAPKVVNLLPLVDPKKDTVRGLWRKQKAELICDVPELAARIEIPYQPPEEYDFRVVFTKQQGTDAITMILSAKGRQFMCQWGGWQNRFSGFEMINGQGADQNPTTANIGIQNGVRYVAEVRVRREGISSFLNGKPVSQWKTDYNDLAPRDEWRLRDDRLLGLASDREKTAFHTVEVIEVTGRGTLTRPQ